jgi:hypothetical protein
MHIFSNCHNRTIQREKNDGCHPNIETTRRPLRSPAIGGALFPAAIAVRKDRVNNVALIFALRSVVAHCGGVDDG